VCLHAHAHVDTVSRCCYVGVIVQNVSLYGCQRSLLFVFVS